MPAGITLGDTRGIISVKEAKKLLGTSCNDLPDETIMEVICRMANLSEELLRWQNSSTNQGRGV